MGRRFPTLSVADTTVLLVVGNEPASVTTVKNKIRANAVAFAKRWAGTTSEQGERQTFWNEFFAMFDIDRKVVGSFEALAERASTGNIGWIDLLYPGEMGVEHKSAGADLDAAMGQLVDYLSSIPHTEKPWLLVVCDFDRFRWRNLETGEHGEFHLLELPSHLDLFWWLAGHAKPGEQHESEEDANLKATALLEAVHDGLLDAWFDQHATREWVTRILFCLFADDTGVWDRALFHTYIAKNTRADGSDLGQTIATVFQTLNIPPDERSKNLDEDLASFTYVNGDLFARQLPIPACDGPIREALLRACSFNWARISPAIFGSLFQGVMEPRERRQIGAHYTTEENILRTIRPLFLDDLEAELGNATTRPALEAFRDKIASLTFMDPACGCGNFLVITYRELRRLETECLRRLARAGRKSQRESEGQRAMSLDLLCKVKVDQFYGIEIEEFPALIARTALYLADHIANREVSAEFGEHYVRFPIPAAPHIVIGNALHVDWNDVLPAARANYVFGNPPFAGHITRTKAQSDEMRGVWAKDYAKWLDYVTSWYRVALDYDSNRTIQFAFVSTNSIAQGEQVARLWKPLFQAGYHIDFAHQTFAWTSEARGKAHVHVVIVGFSNIDKKRSLFQYETPFSEAVLLAPKNISPYLVEGPSVAVAGRSTPLSTAMPPVRYGSLPSDGGGLVVAVDDMSNVDDVATKYLRPYVGSKELVNGLRRWTIWMPNGPGAGDLDKSPFLRARLELVKAARLESRNPDSQKLAAQPYRWFHNAQPTRPYVGIPAQVSETRRWYTVALLDADTIASNTLYTADDPDGFLFGVLSSAMFMTWVRSIGGRLKSDLRYSKSVVHNTFPLPQKITATDRAAVVDAGRDLLAAREAAGGTLASMYAPLGTPPVIISAHTRIDQVVDRMFERRKRRWDDDSRLAHLLRRYVKLTGGDPTLFADG